LIFNYDFKIYELTHNWRSYSETCLQSAGTFAWNNHTQLSDIASNFLKHVSDKDAMQQANRWAQRSLALDQSYDNYLLCSRLNQKLKNTDDAIKMAKKAMVLAKKMGWDGTEAEELLKELSTSNKSAMQ
jgi:hypothetical protein